MTEGPIVFLDSGIGGLSYLLHAKKSLPDEHFIYVADQKNFPYGEKSYDHVLKLVPAIMRKIVRLFNPKAIVIACNTAAVIALAALRKEFELPFVGVVPAIKPAAEKSKHRRIGIFATNRTVNDAYTENLIREFARDCTIISYPGAETVSYIERKYFFEPENEKYAYINNLAKIFLRDRIDSLVLGCTHFVYIEEELRMILNGSIDVLDSREGVTRQLVRVLAERKISASRKSSKSNEVYTSAENNTDSLLNHLAERSGLSYMGNLGKPER